MPRPKTHPHQHRTRRIVFRLTDAEFLRLSHEASTNHTTVNRLARRLTLTRAKDVIDKAEQSHDPALIKQLYYIGHNLNQLTKNTHVFGRVSPKVQQLCERIEALMDEALEKEL